ncbi:quaternary ammonium compound efflux SMR transporter SugE [Henriciella sp.]|uniref:DMT family transporter n=1 Tax=Henriciella sp. TaxID=1968823 RepID=UPI00260B92EB|nr:quaternary ammonium compound efflux SMR transporter SugE [Henriciella sp.]
MAWIILFIAGLLEVVWAAAMKQSDGFTRLQPSIVTLVAMLGSFSLLAWSMRVLPLGTAYTIWTGIGAIGAFLVGVMFMGESLTMMRLLAAGLIVGGLVLMRLSATA